MRGVFFVCCVPVSRLGHYKREPSIHPPAFFLLYLFDFGHSECGLLQYTSARFALPQKRRRSRCAYRYRCCYSRIYTTIPPIRGAPDSQKSFLFLSGEVEVYMHLGSPTASSSALFLPPLNCAIILASIMLLIISHKRAPVFDTGCRVSRYASRSPST